MEYLPADREIIMNTSGNVVKSPGPLRLDAAIDWEGFRPLSKDSTYATLGGGRNAAVIELIDPIENQAATEN